VLVLVSLVVVGTRSSVPVGLSLASGLAAAASGAIKLGSLHSAIRTRHVRAADIQKGARAQRAPALAGSCGQEELTKPVKDREPIRRHRGFVGSDEDGGSPANIAVSVASY
jgi:hypothetical protein